MSDVNEAQTAALVLIADRLWESAHATGCPPHEPFVTKENCESPRCKKVGRQLANEGLAETEAKS